MTIADEVMTGFGRTGKLRNHLHHVLLAHGFSTTQTTVILHSTSLALGCIGLALDVASVPNYLMFWMLAGIFAGYCLAMSRAWKVIETRALTSHQ